jgi:hypothetical protein
MNIDIPWIGYNPSMAFQKVPLEQAGFNVMSTPNMQSGLDLIQRKLYPLVIVQDWIPTGGLSFPVEIPRSDPAQMTRHFLAQVRTLPGYKEKPIIVPYYRGEDQEKLKLDDFVDPINMLDAESATLCILDAIRKRLFHN